MQYKGICEYWVEELGRLTPVKNQLSISSLGNYIIFALIQ